MGKVDRSKYYKEPTKFMAQTLWESEFLTKIDLEHWKHFDAAVKSGQNYKIGDIIQNSVDLTAKQLVKILDEFLKLSTIDEVKEKAQNYIDEIQKEIKL